MCVLDKCGTWDSISYLPREQRTGPPNRFKARGAKVSALGGQLSREADKLPWHQAWLEAKQHVHHTHRVS